MKVEERILNGAFELFMQYGIKSVTMDDLAVHLSMSKKTIYQHYKDKDELVFQMTRNHFEEEEKEIGRISKAAKDPVHEMMGIWKYLQSILSKMNPSLIYDLKKYHLKAYDNFLEFQNRCVSGTVTQNLEKGVETGVYRKEIDISIMTRLKLIEIESGFNFSIFPLTEFHPLEVQTQLFNHYLYGILTQEGIELYKKYEASI